MTTSVHPEAPPAVPVKSKSRSFWSSVAVLCSGAVGVQIFSALCSPLLTRLYSPAEMGVLGIFNAIVMILLLVGTLQYEMAIALPEQRDEARDVALVALFSLLAVAALTVPALLLFGDRFFRLLNAESLLPYWWLIPVGLAASGTYQVLNVWTLRVKRHGDIARTSVSQTLVQLAVQLGCGFLKTGFIGLLAGAVLGRFSGIAKLGAAARAKDAFFALPARLGPVLGMARRYVEFPLYSCPGALLRLGVIQFTPLFLSGKYSLLQAGFFALQERLIMVPLATLGGSIASVFYVEASELYTRDRAALHRLFRSTVKRLFLIGTGPALVLLIFGPQLFELIFGARWTEAGRYAQILALPALARFVSGPVFRCLTIIGHQKVQLLCDVAGFLLLAAGFYYCHVADLSAIAAVVVFGVSTSATYLSALFAAEFHLGKIVRESRSAAG